MHPAGTLHYKAIEDAGGDAIDITGYGYGYFYKVLLLLDKIDDNMFSTGGVFRDFICNRNLFKKFLVVPIAIMS